MKSAAKEWDLSRFWKKAKILRDKGSHLVGFLSP